MFCFIRSGRSNSAINGRPADNGRITTDDARAAKSIDAARNGEPANDATVANVNADANVGIAAVHGSELDVADADAIVVLGAAGKPTEALLRLHPNR